MAEEYVPDAVGVLDAWFHWAAGADPAHTFAPSHGAFLFPLLVWICGWNHLWAGVLEHVLEAQAEWPARLAKMRAFVRWRRVAEYRNVFARRLREFGHCELAEVVAAAFNATFAHWLRRGRLKRALGHVSRGGGLHTPFHS